MSGDRRGIVISRQRKAAKGKRPQNLCSNNGEILFFLILCFDFTGRSFYGVDIGLVTGDMITIMQLTSSVYSYSVEVEIYYSKETQNCNADPDY